MCGVSAGTGTPRADRRQHTGHGGGCCRVLLRLHRGPVNDRTAHLHGAPPGARRTRHLPRAAAEEGMAEAWAEEVLRREPPVTTWRRITARTTRLGGVELPAGAPLLLILIGIGSDSAVFQDPKRMCPHRANVRHHRAFGMGRHRGPGASLARTEAAAALRAAAHALPGIRPTAEPEEAPVLGLWSFRAPLEVAVEQPWATPSTNGHHRRAASPGDAGRAPRTPIPLIGRGPHRLRYGPIVAAVAADRR
ncbi:cytochrome P450 [Streptomyces sp. NPDC005017]|uniref:cytochrome P450 n=1 Tax=Streptomyces sp. NPDC005017 TaxID=3364706 RepID=UPI00367EDD28